MIEISKRLLRFIVLEDPTLGPSERESLLALSQGAIVPNLRIEPPLLLTANDSAKFLGLSTDAFAKARKEHPDRLTPIEVHRGHIRWSKMQLVAYATPSASAPFNDTKPGQYSGRNENAQTTPWALEQTPAGRGSVSCPS